MQRCNITTTGKTGSSSDAYTPQSDYIVYSLGEQVVIPGIDVAKILFHK